MTPRERGKLDLTLSSLNDALTYPLNGADWVVATLRLGLGSAWTGGAVVTAEVAFDAAAIDFQGFPTAVTYAGTGTGDRLRVTGATAFRLRVSTAAAGSVTVVPTVAATRDRP